MVWKDVPLFDLDGRRVDVLVGLDPDQSLRDPTTLLLRYPTATEADLVEAGGGFGAGFRVKVRPHGPNAGYLVRAVQRNATGTLGLRVVDVATGEVLGEATGAAGTWVEVRF